MLLAAAGLGVNYDDIVANWADITFASPTTSGTNSNVTVTFTVGPSRTFRIDYVTLVNTLEYRIDSGIYTSCPTGTEFSITSGQTLNFGYPGASVNESTTISVIDVTDLGRTIDTFNVSVSGY